MTPPRVARDRAFVGLNVATLLVYAGLSIMFFVLSFDLIDRRGLTPTEAGLAFLPFTLGVGLLSRLFGAIADNIGARIMLIAGSVGAGIADAWLALGKTAAMVMGVIAPMTLLGISFAVLVTPLTASVMSSLPDADEGLASGINNAVARVAQLAGVALAAGVASYSFGYQAGLMAAAALSLTGALYVTVGVPAAALRANAS
jgi:predicted MFS family arabinose efflux permease